jgi:hypothetical protein
MCWGGCGLKINGFLGPLRERVREGGREIEREREAVEPINIKNAKGASISVNTYVLSIAFP